MDAYGEVQHYDCGKCYCNVNGRINEREERLKVRKFLIGLNDQFHQVRSHILSLDTLPNLSKVYAMVSHEETQQQLQTALFIKSINFKECNTKCNIISCWESHMGHCTHQSIFQKEASTSYITTLLQKW